MSLTDLQISAARTRISAGESLSAVARSLDVPKSTLSQAIKELHVSDTSSSELRLRARQPLFWDADMTEIRWKNFGIALISFFALGFGLTAAWDRFLR